jgi:hypothetical protein
MKRSLVDTFSITFYHPTKQDAFGLTPIGSGLLEKEISMTSSPPPLQVPNLTLSGECSLSMMFLDPTGSASFSKKIINDLPRFNASYSVVFIRDGAKKRRDLAYARARDLQRELGVAPGLQCVPSLP